MHGKYKFNKHTPTIAQITVLTNTVFWEYMYKSEWLLFNANSAIFQLYHGENKLIFDEMIMRPALL